MSGPCILPVLLPSCTNGLLQPKLYSSCRRLAHTFAPTRPALRLLHFQLRFCTNEALRRRFSSSPRPAHTFGPTRAARRNRHFVPLFGTTPTPELDPLL